MPSTRLVLKAKEQRVLEPVVDVRAPQQRPLDLDIDVLEPGRVHYASDVVGGVLEYDVAVVFALVECRKDCRTIIALRVMERWDRARLGAFGPVPIVGVGRTFAAVGRLPAGVLA